MVLNLKVCLPSGIYHLEIQIKPDFSWDHIRCIFVFSYIEYLTSVKQLNKKPKNFFSINTKKLDRVFFKGDSIPDVKDRKGLKARIFPTAFQCQTSVELRFLNLFKYFKSLLN
jgi:hypothetical protein